MDTSTPGLPEDTSARASTAPSPISDAIDFGTGAPTSTTATTGNVISMPLHADAHAPGNYKGKALRSWPQLPPEVIRLIATYHLHIVSTSSPLPSTWDVPLPSLAHPHSRQNALGSRTNETREGERTPTPHGYIPYQEHLVYAAARDTRELEVVMCVCPAWGGAVEHHTFWTTAIALLDPYNSCAHFGWEQPALTNTNASGGGSAPARRLSPYRHFRSLLACACLPCRINAPLTSHGLGSARRTISTLRLGVISVCREHYDLRRRGPEYDPRRKGAYPDAHGRTRGGGRWCGVCFVDGELGRRARGEAVRVAKEELARAEGALVQARWTPGSAVHRATDIAKAAVDAARSRVQRADEEWNAHLRAGLPFTLAGFAAIGAGTGSLGLGGYTGIGGDGGVAENEDETVFPGVAATCRSCRAEWLWRYALLAGRVAKDPGAVSSGLPVPASSVFDTVTNRPEAGGAEELLRALGASGAAPGIFTPEDGVVRGAVSAFVELGEGTVNHVLVVAGERGWLRAQTRWAELMRQALASKRWAAGETGAAYASNDRGRGGAGGGGGGAGERQDYSGHAEVVLVTREEREREQAERRRRRARSPSLESVDPAFLRTKDHAYANNATNAAAYARAGYTTTNSTGGDDYDEAYDYDEEEEDDSELEDDFLDDEEEVAAALEMTVKEMALIDWARGRVLDGAWVAPADVYYGVKVPGLETPEAEVRAVHPVSWAISPPSSPPHPASSAHPTTLAPTTPGGEERHPGPAAPAPPTYALAEAAHHAHMKAMRMVLLPAFKNVVRRIIVECALDAADADAGLLSLAGADITSAGEPPRKPQPLDPAMRASRMTLGDVVRQVREEEALWFDGIDWSEKRRNAREQEQERLERERVREREQDMERRHRTEGSDDSAAGTPRTSDTSPVLSTSTLGTTPSPPPLGEHRKDKLHADAKERERTRQPTIAVDPVLNPPRLLRPIPYVPETIAHLPGYSLEAIRAVWREACAPLYHCRCTICERAMAAQQAAQGGNPTKATTTTTPAPKEKEKQPEKDDKDGPWVMHIPEDDMDTRGAESVVSLVQDGDALYGHPDDHAHHHHDDHDSKSDDDGLTPQERYWLQVEEDEGPGAYEREIELLEDMKRDGWGGYTRGEGGTSDGDEYEDEEVDGDGDGTAEPYALWPVVSPSKGTGRKRSVDELEPDADKDGQALGERGGTPPKRARTVEPSPRLVKRRSEELDFDERDAETASTGSAPKRARLVNVDSPPDTSTPGTAASEESASTYDVDMIPLAASE